MAVADTLSSILEGLFKTPTTQQRVTGPDGRVYTIESPQAGGRAPILDLAGGVLGMKSAGQQLDRLSPVYAANEFDKLYQQLNQQLATLSSELADVNNPQFQARVAARTDQLMMDYEKRLRAAQAMAGAQANRLGTRNSSMGLVNPERRDEAIARSMQQFRVQAEAQARAEVTKEMLAAAQATRTAGQQAGEVTNQNRAREAAGANVTNAQRAAQQAAGLGGAQGLLNSLGPSLGAQLIKALIGGGLGETGAGGLPRGVPGAPGAPASPGDYTGGGGGGFENVDWAAAARSGAMPEVDLSNLGDYSGGAGDYGTWAAPPADIPEWDVLPPPSFEAPAFEMPAVDLSDLSDYSSSYDGLDYGGWDAGGGDWGTGADFGNVDYGAYF